jgi:predicted O-linked N-acetylglucosamine transferase (SPINDLY family)
MEASPGISVDGFSDQMIMDLSRDLEKEGQRDQAIQVYRNHLLKTPNGSHALLHWYEFGRLLHLAGDYERAESAFRSALEIDPYLTEATLALGKTLEAKGHPDKAIQIWKRALPEDALRAELFNNTARVWDQLHSPEQAEQALLQSLKVDRDQDVVITTLLQQRQKLCRWPVLSDSIGVSISQQKESVGPLMSLALFDDPDENLRAARSFLESKGYLVPTAALTKKGKLWTGHQKLRVGFLSADFRLHATSVFFSPLIEHIDRELFEVYLLDITTAADPFPFARQNLLRTADHHIPLQELDDSRAARKIVELEIDILIDLGGLTAGARPGIVIQRPAPFQAAYLGFLASSGLPEMDFIITTDDLFPVEHSHGYSERPLKLSGTYLSFTNDAPIDTGTTRADCGLPEDGTVFCALLNSYKITPLIFDSWMRILRNVPGSVLWLVDENETTRNNLIREADQRGVSADRLRFSLRVHPAEYRTRLALSDLFLDSSPYGNGATTRDVLSANLPVLTKPGNTMMSRLTAHMIRSLGLDEFVVDSLDAYVAKATELGLQRERLSSVRSRIEKAKAESALFDTKSFARHFGNALLEAARTPI